MRWHLPVWADHIWVLRSFRHKRAFCFLLIRPFIWSIQAEFGKGVRYIILIEQLGEILLWGEQALNLLSLLLNLTSEILILFFQVAYLFSLDWLNFRVRQYLACWRTVLTHDKSKGRLTYWRLVPAWHVLEPSSTYNLAFGMGSNLNPTWLALIFIKNNF